MSLPILREHADEVRIFDPRSGEEIVLADADSETLAFLRDAIRAAEEDQRLAKQQIDAEVIGRMDFHRKWTMHAGEYTMTAPSSDPVVEIPDPAALHSELMAFVDAGEVSIEAIDAAVEQVITFKARKRGLDALRKGGGEIAEVIAKHEKQVMPPRRVTVKKAA